MQEFLANVFLMLNIEKTCRKVNLGWLGIVLIKSCRKLVDYVTKNSCSNRIYRWQKFGFIISLTRAGASDIYFCNSKHAFLTSNLEFLYKID